MTFAEIWEALGNIIYSNGVLARDVLIDNENVREYYYPLTSLTEIIHYSEKNNGQYDYDFTRKLYQITDQELIDSFSEDIIHANDLTNQKVNYAENHAMTDLCGVDGQIDLDHNGSVEDVVATKEICEADYLAIIVDNNDNYHALIGVYSQKDKNTPKDLVIWYKPKTPVDVSQFKGLDMWLRFSSINEMIYFLITKYKDDIITIDPATINANEGDETWAVDDKKTTVDFNNDGESEKLKGKLWAYINPKTMRPYDDDYWFHQGEPYLVHSLTLAENKKLKAKKITVTANQWPGMYMMIGETWIRDKETGKDERMQIKIPFCKVKSDHTLTLSADGDPTVFNIDLEVAKPTYGNMIEITTYEISSKMILGENGCYYMADGSTQILSE